MHCISRNERMKEGGCVGLGTCLCGVFAVEGIVSLTVD